jgi:vacuolar protein sorting-associated protein 35
MQNLNEMNHLWIRLFNNTSKTRLQRETERNELNMLVGENIVRMSSLEDVTLELYKNLVLPQLLEQIQKCKDVLSQQYLTDCIIQVFPDEFHLHTLEKFLEGCSKLESEVDTKSIFIALMERLANYAAGHPETIEALDKESDVFAVMKRYVDNVLEEQGATDLQRLIELQVAFIRFSIKCYPDKINNVNSILETATKIIKVQPTKNLTLELLKTLTTLLTIPLESLSLAILNLSNFPLLMEYLNADMKKDVAKQILAALISSKQKLTTIDVIEKLLLFIASLLEGELDTDNQYEFETIQNNVAKIVHLLELTNEEELQAITKLSEGFMKGGLPRMRLNLPSLVWALYRLADKCALSMDEEGLVLFLNKIFELSYQLAEAICSIVPQECIRLYLNGALAINGTGLESEQVGKLIDQYLVKSFTIYQEELANSNIKLRSLTFIIGTLEKMTLLSSDSFNILAKRVIQFCTKLLRKQDQCKSILICSHIFASENQVNAKLTIDGSRECRRVP